MFRWDEFVVEGVYVERVNVVGCVCRLRRDENGYCEVCVCDGE